MEELLKDIINIVKWTEEGIKCNELEFAYKRDYESYAYTIIKKRIEEAKKEEEENGKCG